jgi:hypothetical protein
MTVLKNYVPVLASATRFRVAQFQLVNRGSGQLRIAVQVVHIEDRSHIIQAMPGDRDDLRLSAALPERAG